MGHPDFQTAASRNEAWHHRYLVILRACQEGSTACRQAMEILKNSPMSDMLRVLDALAKSKLLALLQDQLPEVQGIRTGRLAAALCAIQSGPSGDYRSGCAREFDVLAPDQQEEIDRFRRIQTACRNLIGKWDVTVEGQTYTYKFSDGFPQYVSWTDPSDIHRRGFGTWKIGPDRIVIAWQSGSVEEWPLPLDPSQAPGVRRTAEGTRGLTASKR